MIAFKEASLTRPITASDLQPGDFLLLRKAWVDLQPLGSSWRLIADVIAMGERLFNTDPEVTHVAIVAGALGDCLEELWTGAAETRELIDERWIIVRPNYESPKQAAYVVAFCRAAVGQAYDFPGLAVLGLERLTGIDIPTRGYICSVLVADALRSVGLDYWPALPSNAVAPCDYLGPPGLRVIARAGVMEDAA
jgi:hypothetical protein